MHCNGYPTINVILHMHGKRYRFASRVCVSAALARGITDLDNARRHNIQQHNLADAFELVGLGELADAVQSSQRLIQF